ncbi:unnamed protein product [Knipowitschia caucasica]|uniref:Uncharacterized protein n=1 Tax=Knipowitschia caucasica TaxID=637954 RepID=A0AAV2IUJ9_KNICA
MVSTQHVTILSAFQGVAENTEKPACVTKRVSIGEKSEQSVESEVVDVTIGIINTLPADAALPLLIMYSSGFTLVFSTLSGILQRETKTSNF